MVVRQRRRRTRRGGVLGPCGRQIRRGCTTRGDCRRAAAAAAAIEALERAEDLAAVREAKAEDAALLA
ncbi:MAG: hypothetical protein ACR2JX_10120 [Mycobacteriales bacterium]